MTHQFPLSSEECELLCAFEKTGSLEALARLVHKDISAVSRRLAQCASKANVLEKRRNRWYLTDLGQRIARWTEESSARQKQELSRKPLLRIGGSRAFMASVLVPGFKEFSKELSNTELFLSSLDGPIEHHLLNGAVDLVFSCGTPNDPAVAHKGKVKERYYAVISKELFKRTKNLPLFEKPHVAFRNSSGLYPWAEITTKATNTVATFNESVSLLEAVKQGIGWAVLPYFAIKGCSDLQILPELILPTESYSVWWLRERKSVRPSVETLLTWLEQQEL